MKRGKAASLMAFVAVLFISLTGCSDKSGGSTIESVNEKVPVDEQETQKEIEIWSRGSDSEAVSELLKQAVQEYSEKTGVKVNLQFIPHSDVVSKWNAAFASGTAPDVIDLGVSHIVERANLGHLLPLDDYYENWENKDDFLPSLKELGIYQDKLYGLSHRPDPNVFIYRKDMFEEAGLDPERAPKNWDEMLEYAQNLVIKDDAGVVTRSGYGMPTTNARFVAHALIHQKGTAFVDDATGMPLFDQPAALETIEYMKQLYGCSAVFDGTNLSEYPILKGEAAMGYLPITTFDQYIRENPDMKDKFGVAGCVPGETEGSWCGVWLYGITSQTEDPDLAWDLITYLISPEVLKMRMEESGIPVPYQSMEDAFVAINPYLNQAVIDAIKCGYANPKVSWSNVYEVALNDMLEQVFYEMKTPEEALADTQEELMKETK